MTCWDFCILLLLHIFKILLLEILLLTRYLMDLSANTVIFETLSYQKQYQDRGGNEDLKFVF